MITTITIAIIGASAIRGVNSKFLSCEIRSKLSKLS